MSPNPDRARVRRRPRRAPAAPAAGPRPGAVVEVDVEAIGARGDGVGRLVTGDKVYVPLALPGDRLRVRLRARRGDGWAAHEVAAPVRAPRATPPCRHFGDCGGCALQHLPPPAYAAWKRSRIVEALARHGLGGDAVALPRIAPPASRRRARLRFDPPARGGVLLGFSARASHRVVDLAVCPVLAPAIAALLPPLRRLVPGLALARDGGEILVTATEGGPDVVVIAPHPPGLADRERLAAFAEEHDLARVSWRPEAGGSTAAEPVAARRAAWIDAGGVAVEPPPGAFLQAAAFGEAALREELLAAVGDPRGLRLADLFAGCGALGLAAAARGAELAAFEADATMVAALARAARAGGFGHRVRAEARDLEHRPLQPEELAGFDALILDPPRAGARAQSAALAAAPAGPPLVVMASCDPATFARDARLLVDGGYRLERTVPIDQFLWSGQVELAATFRRSAGAGKFRRLP